MRNLDIASLRSLVAIADTEGVTKAAAQINLTQSAVSMQIKRLEDLFGAKLLHREGRGVVLSSLGEHLVSYARKMIALNDETWERLTNEDFEGEVRLGVPVDIVYPNIPTVLQRARTRFPRLKLSLVSDLTRSLKRRLKEGELDVILATEKRVFRGGVKLTNLSNTWYGAPGGKAHLQRPLPIAMCNHCAQRPAVIRTLDEAGVPWEFVGDTNSELTLDAIVSADLAVAPKLGEPNNPDCVRTVNSNLPRLDDVSLNMYRTSFGDKRLVERVTELLTQTFHERALSAVS